MCTHPSREFLRIPRLHEHRPRPRKLADHAFATADAGDDAPTRHALHHILTVPGYEMAVVDDVFLAFDELHFLGQWRRPKGARRVSLHPFE